MSVTIWILDILMSIHYCKATKPTWNATNILIGNHESKNSQLGSCGADALPKILNSIKIEQTTSYRDMMQHLHSYIALQYIIIVKKLHL